MTYEEIKAEIKKLDQNDDEFMDLVGFVNRKYYNTGDPSEYQKCVQMVNEWLFCATGNFEEQVFLVTKVVVEVFNMRKDKKNAVSATLGIGSDIFYFDLYTSEAQKDGLQDMIRKTAASIENGKATFKDQRGKRYFKGKK